MCHSFMIHKESTGSTDSVQTGGQSANSFLSLFLIRDLWLMNNKKTGGWLHFSSVVFPASLDWLNMSLPASRLVQAQTISSPSAISTLFSRLESCTLF
jgi:hypothetical protein